MYHIDFVVPAAPTAAVNLRQCPAIHDGCKALLSKPKRRETLGDLGIVRLGSSSVSLLKVLGGTKKSDCRGGLWPICLLRLKASVLSILTPHVFDTAEGAILVHNLKPDCRAHRIEAFRR